MHIEGILLQKSNHGENLHKLEVIDHQGICQTLLCKHRQKNDPFNGINIFDTMECNLTKSKTSSLFANNFHLISSRKSIAREYKRFSTACKISTILCNNSKWLDENPDRFKTVNNAMDALLNHSQKSSTIYLKFLFNLIDLEGYPIRQEWIPSLKNSNLEIKPILSKPISECDPDDENKITPLIDSLTIWITQKTDFYIQEN
jgi:recombinational DNA repair protein (RecF pathway)